MSEISRETEKPKSMRERVLSRKSIITMAVTLAGGIAGYLYYHFIGCSSGTCPLTSNPYMSVGIGSLMGYLLASR
jgi:hypothetical protein